MPDSRHQGRAAPEQLQLDLSQPPKDPSTEEKGRSLRSSSIERGTSSTGVQNGAGARVPCHSAAELLHTPGAVLTRSHVRDLGWERRGVDAIFRALPVVAVDGYSRPVIRVEDYLELIHRSTFRDDRVRPIANGSPTPKLSTGSNGKRLD